uniref:Uncharacterized protein n=1 Tax=Oryza glumipatula TaxID=40148 RepID=A0A0E0BGE2_9ORYZ
MQSSPPRAKRRRREAKDDEDAPSASSPRSRRTRSCGRACCPGAGATCGGPPRSSASPPPRGGGGGWDTATEFNVFLDGLLRLRGRRGGDDGARLEWFVLDLGFPAPGTSPAPSTSSTSAARSASASAPSKNGCCWYYYYLTGLSSPGISRHWSSPMSDGLKIFSLVERLSETTNLCLFAHPGMFIFNRDLYWCPTFNKLKTHLKTQRLVRKDSFQTTGSYKPLGQLAFDRLKKIEINHYEFFYERVRKIFKILSTYVTPLQVYMSARCELTIPLLMLLFCILSKNI